jgi:hypothetical protein
MATPKPKPTPSVKAKTAAKPNAASVKKSGIDKLTSIGRTTKESDISFALRHGKITKQEAAAIDPKNFKILLKPQVVRSIEIDLKPSRGGMRGGGSIGGSGGLSRPNK